MTKKRLMSAQEMAKREGVCLLTMYRMIQSAGYVLDRGRAANLFTVDQVRDILSHRAVRGRPKIKTA